MTFSLAHQCLDYFAAYELGDHALSMRACDAYGRESARRLLEHGIPHAGHWFEAA